jgi:hypothetical protein
MRYISTQLNKCLGLMSREIFYEENKNKLRNDVFK